MTDFPKAIYHEKCRGRFEFVKSTTDKNFGNGRWYECQICKQRIFVVSKQSEVIT